MTALVGFFCKDGVVIGADSAATSAAAFGKSGSMPTIEQQVEKLCIVAGKVIIAGTGSVGLGQRFCEQVSSFYDEKGFARGTPISSATDLSSRTIKNFGLTNAQQNEYGALVAFPHSKTHHLVEFEIRNFNPELKDKQMCFVSMGGGQLITDSFLGMLKRVFFPDEAPSVSEATFYTAWTLHQAIELNTGGIKGPIRIAVLKLDDKGEHRASLLDADRIAEHIDHIRGAERHLAEYRKIMGSASTVAPIPDLNGDLNR